MPVAALVEGDFLIVQLVQATTRITQLSSSDFHTLQIEKVNSIVTQLLEIDFSIRQNKEGGFKLP